ncbi:ubiquinone/menaquinone biosynthesis methyltransferase [Thermoplasmatales archaeon]|nr:ubiquinone/menaquinone biosynthesis methyltransferase [Thermoplasmatales archaeon]
MNPDYNGKELYAEGEEKFGSLGAKFYGITRAIPTLRKFYNFVLNDLTSCDFGSVLDIGSGTGFLLLSLAGTTENFRGLGIDPSTQMVTKATNKSKKLNLEDRISFKNGSSRSIPGDSKFDLAYSSLSFHHWKDREDSIKNIMERVNIGGSLIFYEITDDGSFNRKFVRSHLMSRQKFEEISTRLGLAVDIKEQNGYIRAKFKK